MTETAASAAPKMLFEMMVGFKATAVLRAGIDLGVFDAVAEEPGDAAAVAERIGADVRGTRALLRALAGQGLLAEDEAGRYTLVPQFVPLLTTSSPKYCGGIAKVASSQGEWESLGRLAETVRAGKPVTGSDALEPDFPYWVDFATHTTFATTRAAELVAELLEPWAKNRELEVLDAGCGHGLTGYVLAAKQPHAHVVSQDWHTVLEAAEGHASRLGVRDRVDLLPGDAFTVPLGGPYDLILVGNLLFHFAPERAAALLRRLAGALRPDGRIVVLGFTSGDQPPADELHARLLGLLMLSWTEGGEMHASADYERMLAEAGLTETRRHAWPGVPLRVVVAERPASASAAA